MIAGPLVAPVDAPPGLPRGGVVTRVIGVALLVLALTGAWAWFTALSPFGFERWEVYETSHTMTFEPGTYVVYEEFDGAAGGSTRAPLTIFVRSIAGREIDTVALIGEPAPGERDREPVAAAEPYRTPWHEGRPTAEFRIDRAGTYTVTAFPSESSASGSAYSALLTSFVAVAPAGEPGALGSAWGLLVLTFVPLALGLGTLALARLRWPRPRRGRARPYPGDPG